MMQWIVTSSLLIVAVILLRIIGRDRLSARVRYALWALVLIRLLVPFSIGESALSVMNLVVEENDSALVQQDPVLISDLPDTDVTIGTYDPSDTILTNQTITATTPTVETETENPVGRALNILWFAGCAMSGAILLSCNLRLNAALKRSRKPVYVDGCPLPVYETAVVETPCMFGLVRPAVYIIPELTEDEAALRHVLAHELTHYRHLDHIWSFLRCLCLMLHWYNPLVWVAAYLSREDAELACDEGALKQIGDTERTAYGETLIALTCTGHSGLMTTATTMTGSKRSLTERIRRIANNRKASLIVVLMVLLLAAVAAVVVFTGQRTDTGVNGVWRTTVSVLGVDVESGTEGWLEYEFKDGQGRLITYVNGEIRSAVALRYTLGDKLIITEQNEYGDTLTTVEYDWTREGDTLTLSRHKRDMIFEEIERQYPGFYDVEGYVDLVGIYESEEEPLVADFSEAEEAALLALLRSGEVKKAPNGPISQGDHVYYLHLWDYDRDVRSLTLTDGLISNGQRENYSLSNMEEIQAYLEGLSWRKQEYPASPRQALEMTSVDGVLLSLSKFGDGAQREEVSYFSDLDRAVNAETFYEYALKTVSWTEAEAPEDVRETAPWAVTLTGQYWSLTAYAGCDLVRFTTATDGFADRWYAPGMDSFGTRIDVYNILRQWYDELEYEELEARIPPADSSLDYLTAAQQLVAAENALHLQVTEGSKYHYTYVSAQVTASDIAQQETERLRQRGSIGDGSYCFGVETIFIPEPNNDTAMMWAMAGNTVEYTGDDPAVPEGALQCWACGIITQESDGWRVTHMGTSW